MFYITLVELRTNNTNAHERGEHGPNNSESGDLSIIRKYTMEAGTSPKKKAG
jgi:hypothetical protein